MKPMQMVPKLANFRRHPMFHDSSYGNGPEIVYACACLFTWGWESAQSAQTKLMELLVQVVKNKRAAGSPSSRRAYPRSFSHRYGYLPHRWGILLFTPPPGSRARRLGWSQYMHECVGASQGYRGVVGGLGLGLVLGGGVSMAICPTGVGIPLVAAPRQDRLGCTIDPMIALRRANTIMHVL